MDGTTPPRLGGARDGAGSGLLADQLHQVGPRDPVAFAVGPALLLVVALVAAGIPARRGTFIDPVEAMRVD